ncbi:MAG: 50S ribosomal protein L11 methyltransferase, partial [Acidobacteria bacterium]|nr:50S ribosomal protein L11 methyltransferase [Acidobacteriota bacterium]
MAWNQLTLDVPDDLADAVVGELSDDGVAGVWESPGPADGLTRLTLYFGIRSNIDQIERRVQNVFTRSSKDFPSITRSIVEDCDWTDEWKKSYRSFEIGSDFFVIPSWETATCPSDRIPIRIDPGQAFGTGTHETTQLAIEALERWVEPSHTVLDVGTGSGILAIAARLLAARKVIACDIDPVAAGVARANIERNAADNVFTFCGSVDAVQKESIRLVLCNLTADLIVSLFAEIDRVMEPHAIAVFSGILNEQNEEVREVFARFSFSIHEESIRGEWLAL